MSAARRIDYAGLISGLQRLIRQPSVSATGQGIIQCAGLVRDELEKAGIKSRILKIRGAAPLVYGEVKSTKNPAKTLLFYNHYDVQPAEPLELWKYPPFEGKIIGNKVYGRGASDDKGELMTRIKGTEALLSEYGDVPCNIKFVIEGEEETGSANIGRYLSKYKKMMSCDGIIWEFGYVNPDGSPLISLGMKGLLSAEIIAKGPKIDAHSSLAVLLENPAWRLVNALYTLRGTDGTVLIKDWYKEAQNLSAEDMRIIRAESFDEEKLKTEYGVDKFVGNITGEAAKEALVSGATCNIAGLSSGYQGEGTKTVLPASAVAKLDFRLVPDMDPAKQEARLRAHLIRAGYPDIIIKTYHGVAASRTDPKDPLVDTVKNAAKKSFGACTISLSSAGTGPMDSFSSILNAPCVSVGCTHVFARIHSPNEFARIDLLRKAARCICHIAEGFSEAGEVRAL